jgi:hypothetical protein
VKRAGKCKEVNEDAKEEDLAEVDYQRQMHTIEQAAAISHREDEQHIREQTVKLHQGQYYPLPLKTPSPTRTEILHPSYPYQEYTSEDHNITLTPFKCPYLTMEVDRFLEDPCIHSKQEISAPTYDKGPLQAQPTNVWNSKPIDNDFEHEVETYPFGKSTYLDT